MRAAIFAMLLGLAACNLPKDPAGTLERVRGGVLRAGFTEAEPWIRAGENGEPEGVEADLVRQFATAQGARIEWRKGSSEELLTALEHREIDLFVGGLDEKSPWKTRVAMTAPFFTDRAFLGFPHGHESIESLDGTEVAVEEDSWLIPVLEKKGAIPIEQKDPFAQGVLLAASEWKLRLKAYRPGEKPLSERKHVMAVPPGENALLVALERCLLEQKDAIPQMLAASESAP